MARIVWIIVLTIGILATIDHFLYFSFYTDAAISLLLELRRSFGW